jgi:hypothetical protein
VTRKLAALWEQAVFLKHLVAGLLSACIAIAGAAWAASAKWNSMEARVSGVEQRVEAHEGAPSLHPTLLDVATQADRMARLEEQQKTMANEISQLRQDVREILRRIR